jgi:NadR type nicotinamide-nucleotide adenylyltransferase
MRTVCLHGPESTGKTTLATELAEHFGTVAVPEYGRLYCEIFGNECDLEDLRAIRRGEELLIKAAERKAKNGLLVLDTDAVMTAVWADVLLGTRPPDLDRIDHPADLYLLCDIDVPFVADGIRYFPDQATRAKMFAQTRAELDLRHLPFVLITGSRFVRLKTAVDAITARFPEIATP